MSALAIQQPDDMLSEAKVLELAENLYRDAAAALSRFSTEAGVCRAYASNEAPDATATGFCLFYFARTSIIARGLDYHGVSDALHSHEFLSRIFDANVFLAGEIIEKYGGLAEETPPKDIQSVPSYYDTTLQASGLLACWNLQKQSDVPIFKEDVQNQLKGALRNLFSWLARHIEPPEKLIQRDGAQPNSPNPFLNFWAGAAMALADGHELLSDAPELQQRLRKHTDQLGLWALDHVARHVALHHAGMTSHFDAAELAYSIACAWATSAHARHADLAKHGLDVLLVKCLRDGCLPASWPVIVNKKTGFLLQVPTTETLATLLLCAPNDCRLDFGQLRSHILWLADSREAAGGWRPETAGYWAPPTSFMVASAFTFGATVAWHATERLDAAAREALGAKEPPNMGGVHLPAKVEKVLQDHFISARQNPTTENPPYHSMIVYGPPGTSKTTMAKYLAHKLNWGIVVLNQSSFLGRGVASIDGEVERVFRLLHRLRNVVVVFDEVEELVRARDAERDRESRILTTAMLPRIQDLHDSENVIFLFLTNHIEAMDKAITRIGRFDAIQLLGPPDRSARKAILNGLTAELLKKLDDARRVLLVESLVPRTDALTYGDLRELVLKIARCPDGDEEMLEEVCKVARQRAPESLDEFEQKSRQVDRP